MTDKKYTVCIDFDGTLTTYASGYTPDGDIPDGPTDGAKEAMEKLYRHYKVVVYSARAGTAKGNIAICNWLDDHGIPCHEVTAVKPPAIAYVDDRAVRFDDDWKQVLQDINVPPWHVRKRKEEADG